MSGYTSVPNAILETLNTSKFNAKQRRVLDLIIRLSYGCQKPTALIQPATRFRAAGIYKQDIRAVLGSLIEANVIFADLDLGEYMINESIENWKIDRYPISGEEYGKLIGFNLSRRYRVSESLTAVSESLTEESVNHLPSSKRTTDDEVSESLTNIDDNANKPATSRPPKDNKERKEERKTVKSQSLQNFERYERGGREYAVTMQNRYGLQPEADLLEHFQKEGYDLDETSHGGGAKFLDVSDVDG